MKIIIVSLALIVCWVSCDPSTTTRKPFVRLSCKGHNPNGFFVDPKDPGAFHQCSHGRHVGSFHCQPNMVFNEKEQVCVRSMNDAIKCPVENGLFPFPGNLHKFIECYDNRAYVRTCSGELIFDQKKAQCVYNEGQSPWPSDPTTTQRPSTAGGSTAYY